ncbi:MAG TPA: hypothetical protein VHU19_11115 [Pyrinomonadaceae bacterium]|jgi:hypothetical protein|nr:hypothetical protein [Pyrinomonadaceae bacterium]
MEVNINEMQSNVRAVDGDAALSPQTMQKIIETVMQAVEERERHQDRVKAEQQTSGGARNE